MFKKLSQLILILSCVFIPLSSHSEDEYKNGLLNMTLEQVVPGIVKVKFYTETPYYDKIVVNKKSENQYVIFLPETANIMTNAVKNNTSTIIDIDIKTQKYTDKPGYTKITFYATAPIEVLTQTYSVRDTSYELSENDFNKLIETARAMKPAEKEIKPTQVAKQTVESKKISQSKPKTVSRTASKKIAQKTVVTKATPKKAAVAKPVSTQQVVKTTVKPSQNTVTTTKVVEKTAQNVINESIQQQKSLEQVNETVSQTAQDKNDSALTDNLAQSSEKISANKKTVEQKSLLNDGTQKLIKKSVSFAKKIKNKMKNILAQVQTNIDLSRLKTIALILIPILLIIVLTKYLLELLKSNPNVQNVSPLPKKSESQNKTQPDFSATLNNEAQNSVHKQCIDEQYVKEVDSTSFIEETQNDGFVIKTDSSENAIDEPKTEILNNDVSSPYVVSQLDEQIDVNQSHDDSSIDLNNTNFNADIETASDSENEVVEGLEQDLSTILDNANEEKSEDDLFELPKLEENKLSTVVPLDFDIKTDDDEILVLDEKSSEESNDYNPPPFPEIEDYEAETSNLDEMSFDSPLSNDDSKDDFWSEPDEKSDLEIILEQKLQEHIENVNKTEENSNDVASDETDFADDSVESADEDLKDNSYLDDNVTEPDSDEITELETENNESGSEIEENIENIDNIEENSSFHDDFSPLSIAQIDEFENYTSADDSDSDSDSLVEKIKDAEDDIMTPLEQVFYPPPFPEVDDIEIEEEEPADEVFFSPFPILDDEPILKDDFDFIDNSFEVPDFPDDMQDEVDTKTQIETDELYNPLPFIDDKNLENEQLTIENNESEEFPEVEDLPEPAENIVNEPLETIEEKELTEIISKYEIKNNSGFQLVNLEDSSAFLGYINDEIIVLKKFNAKIDAKLQVRLDEQKTPETAVYAVRIKNYRAFVEVDNKDMKIILEF